MHVGQEYADVILLSSESSEVGPYVERALPCASTSFHQREMTMADLHVFTQRRRGSPHTRKPASAGAVSQRAGEPEITIL